MVSKLFQKIRRGYIRNQAISYFVFSLLLTRAYVINKGSDRPFFSLDISGRLPYPMPVFNLPSFIPIFLGGVCLLFSIFFTLALLFKRHRFALRLALCDFLDIPYSIMLAASFIISWLSGLNPVAGLSRPWIDIFFGTGLFIFFVLIFKDLLSGRRFSKVVQRTKKEKIYRVLVKLCLFCLLWGALISGLDIKTTQQFTSIWKWVYNPWISLAAGTICIIPILALTSDEQK